MVDERGVHRTKQSLQRRSKTWLRRWTLMFAHSIQGQQLLKVDAPEFGTPIHGNGRREPTVTLDTQAHHHHARTVGRWVKGQVESYNPSRMGKNHEGEPAFANGLTCF